VELGRGTVEGVDVSDPFWRDRPTFVTGGSGLLGSWVVRRLVEAGAEVVCLLRDWVPGSELVRSGTLERVRVVRGDVRDEPLLERTLGEYEVSTVFHLAAQTIVGVANRNPLSTFESNVGGTWALLEACRQRVISRRRASPSLGSPEVVRKRAPSTTWSPVMLDRR